MDCTHFRELGSAIIDNEATDAEIKEFNEHISTCAECAQWFETIKILKDETANLEEEVPEELKTRVMNSVSMVNKKPSFFSRYRFTAVAAVIAVVILASSSLGIFESPQSVPKDSTTPTVQQSPDLSVAPMPQSRLIAAPSGESTYPAPETIPFEEEFSYVVYIKDQSVCDFLIDTGYEVKKGYRYYRTDKKLSDFEKYPQEIISFDSTSDAIGLVVVKEPVSSTK